MRLCKKCKKVEDEIRIHFLIECKLYDSVRKKFFSDGFSDNNIISTDGNTTLQETHSYTVLTIKTRTSSQTLLGFTTACFELRKIFSN